MNNTQTCSRCKQANEIAKNQRWCKVCCKEYRTANKERIRERNLEYQQSNRDKTRGWNRKHYWKDAEAQRQRSRAQYAANPEKFRARSLEWHKNNPDYGRESSKRRLDRVREATIEKITPEQWLQVLVDFDYKCAYCGASGIKLEKEHRQPVSRGGAHAIYNIVPSCKSCNCKKNDKTPEEFATSYNLTFSV